MSLIKGVHLDRAKRVYDLSFTHDGKLISKYGFSILDRVWWVWMEHMQADEMRAECCQVICSEIVRRWNLVEDQEAAKTPIREPDKIAKRDVDVSQDIEDTHENKS